MISVLDDVYKIDFFKTFFYSKYSNDKKTAIKYFKYFNQNIESELLDEYFSSNNILYLMPLLKEEFSILLSKNIEYIWDNDLPFYVKKSLLEVVAKENFSELDFLKRREYESYLLASLIAKKINAKEAVSKIHKIKKNKRHFTILNISRETDFNTIEKEIKKYIR